MRFGSWKRKFLFPFVITIRGGGCLKDSSDRKPSRILETWRRDRHVAGEAVERRKVNGIEGRCRRYDCVCVRQGAYLIVCWQLFASTSGTAEEEREEGRRGGQRYLSAACKGTSRTRYFDDRRMHATAMTAVTTAYLSSTSFVGQWVWNRYHPSFCTLPHIFSRWWKTFLVFGRGDPFFLFL